MEGERLLVGVPSARTGMTSPLSGMQILDVGQAASRIVASGSRCSAFRVDDELSDLDETQTLFGDAKVVSSEVAVELSKLPAKEVATL